MNQTLHAGWYLVATEDDLTADITPLDVGGRRLMVTRTASDDGDAIFTVADATCPHRGCVVAPAGAKLTCPCHGSTFDAATGAVEQGPATTGLKSLPATVSGDGVTLG